MLHILLLILKIIGIVLTVVLGIILFFCAVVLFMPVRYKIDGEGTGDWKDVHIQICFSWFLHLISGYALYEEKEFSWQCRIFWKKLNQRKSESKSKVKKEKSVRKEIKKQETAKSQKSHAQKTPEIEESKVQESSEIQENPQTAENENGRNRKKQNVYQKIKYTIQNICAKIKHMIEQKEKLTDFINDEVHGNAFRRVKKEVFRLVRFLRPKRFQMYLRYGFEDPCMTGKVLAGLSVLYPFYGDGIEIFPDFEELVLEGTLKVKGRIYGIHFIIILWNLYFDKHVRLTYKHVKEFEL